MAISRRKFLAAGTVAAVCAGPLKAFAGKSLLSPKPSAASPLGNADALRGTFFLNRKIFASQLNTEFALDDGAEKNFVKLIQVKDLSRGKERKAEGRECFSLLFVASPNRALKQNTYTFTH